MEVFNESEALDVLSVKIVDPAADSEPGEATMEEWGDAAMFPNVSCSHSARFTREILIRHGVTPDKHLLIIIVSSSTL